MHIDKRQEKKNKKNKHQHGGAPWKRTCTPTRQGWMYHFIVWGWTINFQKESRPPCQNIFKDTPDNVLTTKPGVLTESSGHPQWCLWRLKQGVVLNQNSFFLCFLCLNLKLCDKRKNSIFLLKLTIAKYLLTMVHQHRQHNQHHAETLHRDRCVSCRLISSGPNHCEAYGGGTLIYIILHIQLVQVFSLHIIIYFKIMFS